MLIIFVYYYLRISVTVILIVIKHLKVKIYIFNVKIDLIILMNRYITGYLNIYINFVVLYPKYDNDRFTWNFLRE